MTTYNPNDFYPSSGARVKSDGTIANTADGFNTDGSENVVLEGRNAVQTILANAIQIRDTATHLFPGNVSSYLNVTLQDVTMYGEKAFLVSNTTDQAASVSILADVRQTPGNTSTRIIIVNSDSLAAGASKWYSSGSYTPLKEPIPYLAIQTSFATAPTTGSVSIYLEGAQR